jgi:hypothetical protein
MPLFPITTEICEYVHSIADQAIVSYHHWTLGVRTFHCGSSYHFLSQLRFVITYIPVELYLVHLLFMLFVFIYWCPTGFPYQMMSVSFNSNTRRVTSGWRICTPLRSLPILMRLILCQCMSFCHFSFCHCIVCPS